MFPSPQPVVPSLQARVHPDEWQARLELAACYRVFALLGWTEMIYNHITLRLPDSVTGGKKHFLINPFGLHYSEVTASNLLKIDVQGNKLDDSPWNANPAGFTVHSAIHEHIAQAHCVMHTHTTAGLAVACTATLSPRLNASSWATRSRARSPAVTTSLRYSASLGGLVLA